MIKTTVTIMIAVLIMTPIISAGNLKDNVEEGMQDAAIQAGGAALGTKNGIEKAFKGDFGGAFKSYGNAAKSGIGSATSIGMIPFKKD